jgi:hypothetical protein
MSNQQSTCRHVDNPLALYATPPIDCYVLFRLLWLEERVCGGLESLQTSLSAAPHSKAIEFWHSTINPSRTYLIIRFEFYFETVGIIELFD